MTIPSSSSSCFRGFDSQTIPRPPLRSDCGSTASLLRARPPQQPTNKYSFEDSPLMTPITYEILLFIFIHPLTLASAFASDGGRSIQPPSAPVTFLINMNDLHPSSKNKLTLNISGTIVVRKADDPSDSRYSSVSSSHLPAFKVIATEAEAISTTIRNVANVEVRGSHYRSIIRGRASVRSASVRRAIGKN